MNAATRRGTGLLVAAMACFSLSDALAKQLSAELAPAVLAWTRYLLLMLTALPLGLARPHHFRSAQPALQLARAAGLVGSAVLFLHALQRLPMAEATAMVFASPLFVTVLSVLLLREQVRGRRWIPVTLGFVGVLVVARPGAPTFGWAAALPILSSMAWAVAVVCTRKLSERDTAATTMIYSSAAGCLGLALLLPGEIAWRGHLPALLGMAAAWCCAQWLTIWAYRTAQAAQIAPFAYSQLLWAVAFGWVASGHLPDAVGWIGIGVIAASGVLAAVLPSSPRT